MLVLFPSSRGKKVVTTLRHALQRTHAPHYCLPLSTSTSLSTSISSSSSSPPPASASASAAQKKAQDALGNVSAALMRACTVHSHEAVTKRMIRPDSESDVTLPSSRLSVHSPFLLFHF